MNSVIDKEKKLDKEKYLNSLINLYGESAIDLDKISLAFDFGKKAHENQARKTGEPYFTHPVSVSLILAELKMDTETIIGALLHDVIEDTIYTYDDVKERFGENVAKLVDGVTKLGKFKFNSREEFEAENLRKMFLAMAEDVRVILIKLADRLHNIRTLSSLPEEKQKRISQETLEIYAPIAHRLGIFKIKSELEDTSLRYLHPNIYKQILNLVNQKSSERERDIALVVHTLKKALADYKPDAEVYGRPKSFYSIYQKMYVHKKNFNEIFDVTAVRILVDTVEECWNVLGIVHSLWTPIHGRLKDYISVPKPNMYRSLHTTVIGGTIGKPFEIQIRTKEMHRMAEYGIAAHWKYKTQTTENEQSIEKKLNWVRQLIEDQQEYDSPKEFVDTLKFELVSGSVYVCTPQGKVLELPSGATPVDFAYKIHSAVGNSCVGAKVDGRIVPLNYILQNGKIVEILTSKNSSGPSRDWLKFVKSSMARTKIKHWFKKQNREENIEKGKEILERELHRNNFNPSVLQEKIFQNAILEKLTIKTMDDLYAAIGYGGIMTSQVIPKVRSFVKEQDKLKLVESNQPEDFFDPYSKAGVEKIKADKGIIVEGVGGTYIKLAKCCSPVPGDDIIGFITRGRGVTVHRSDCKNLEKSEEAKNRYINVRWALENKVSYNSILVINAYDRPGLLSDVSLTLADMNAAVNGVNARKDKDGIAVMKFDVGIIDKEHLEKIMRKFKSVEGVIEVRRVNS